MVSGSPPGVGKGASGESFLFTVDASPLYPSLFVGTFVSVILYIPFPLVITPYSLSSYCRYLQTDDDIRDSCYPNHFIINDIVRETYKAI